MNKIDRAAQMAAGEPLPAYDLMGAMTEEYGAKRVRCMGLSAPGEAFYQKLLEEASAERSGYAPTFATNARGPMIHEGIRPRNRTWR